MTRAQETYHRQMHRLYRATRAQMSLRVSPYTPEFGRLVAAAFEQQVEKLELRPPR